MKWLSSHCLTRGGREREVKTGVNVWTVRQDKKYPSLRGDRKFGIGNAFTRRDNHSSKYFKIRATAL